MKPEDLAQLEKDFVKLALHKKQNKTRLYCGLLWKVPAILFFIATYAIARPFNDPLFESLDLNALEEALQSTPDASEDLIQIRLFLLDIANYEKRIHLRNRILLELERYCKELGFTTALAAASCAIAGAEAMMTATNPLSSWQIANSIDAFVNQAMKLGLAPSDRLYLNGRLYFILPPSYGQNFGKSLLSWMMLQRMEKDRSSIPFWLGRTYQVQGNMALSKINYEQAYRKGSKAVRFFYNSGFFLSERDWNDGLSFGFSPALFFDTSRGIGASIIWHDDSIFDTDQSGSVGIFATTGESFGINGRWNNPNVISAIGLKALASFNYGFTDFYGIGLKTLPQDRTSLLLHKERFDFRARYGLSNSLYFDMGLMFTNFEILKNQAPSLLSSLKVITFGPATEIGLDSRDSQVDAHHGNLFYVSGYYPQQSIGSSNTYLGLTMHGENHWPIGFSSAIHTKVHLQCMLGKNLPVSQFPRIGDEPLPGVRSGRFQDSTLLVSSIEIDPSIWGPLSMIGFINIASVSNQISDLLYSRFLWGGGGGIKWQMGSLRSQLFKATIGWFGNEATIVLSGGYAF